MQFFIVTLKIETRIDKDAIEKSTLSILEHSLSVDDFYSSLCESLWKNMLEQGADNMDADIYNDFTSKLTVYLKRIVSRYCLDFTASQILTHPCYYVCSLQTNPFTLITWMIPLTLDFTSSTMFTSCH